MPRIVSIVEGFGEIEAVPILIRRISEALRPGLIPDQPRPIRIKRQRLLKEAELERAVELAARKGGPNGRILILLDADEDCPSELAQQVLVRATSSRGDRRIRVVFVKREFEAWFLAAAESIAGYRGVRAEARAPADPESIRGAKEWLSEHMPENHPYRETLDQPAFSAMFDLDAAKRALSFQKFWRDVESLLMDDVRRDG